MRTSRRQAIGIGLLVGLMSAGPASAGKDTVPVQAITFHAEPGTLFVPVEEAARP